MITYSHLVPPFLRNNKLVLLFTKKKNPYFLYEKEKMIPNLVVVLIKPPIFIFILLLGNRSFKLLEIQF
jgi:hypothetical protein